MSLSANIISSVGRQRASHSALSIRLSDVVHRWCSQSVSTLLSSSLFIPALNHLDDDGRFGLSEVFINGTLGTAERGSEIAVSNAARDIRHSSGRWRSQRRRVDRE